MFLQNRLKFLPLFVRQLPASQVASALLLQGLPNALHKRHARTGLPLGVEREVTRVLNLRPTGVMLHP